jgi:hypothetical protein
MEPALVRPLVRRDGFGIPFDVPGHGIEFDADALERFSGDNDLGGRFGEAGKRPPRSLERQS